MEPEPKTLTALYEKDELLYQALRLGLTAIADDVPLQSSNPDGSRHRRLLKELRLKRFGFPAAYVPDSHENESSYPQKME
jgi:hypothetical protein